MSESESDVNEQVGDTDLAETRRRHEAPLSRTLSGAMDEAKPGGNGTGTIGDLLSLSNPFRRENVTISSLSGGLRSNDSSEAIQASIQSRLIEEITEFRESALNIQLNDVREQTEEPVDIVDRSFLRIQQHTYRCPRRLLSGLSNSRQFLRRDNIRLRKVTNTSMVTDSKSFEVMPMSNQSDDNE